MTEKTFKTAGWQPQARPQEGRELDDSRCLIREVVFSLYRQKTELLTKMGMPSQPVSLNQIYLEVCSRIAIKRSCNSWPYPHHEKRWWDRRVNEAACPTYYGDGVAKIASASAGLYMPNPALFVKKPFVADVERMRCIDCSDFLTKCKPRGKRGGDRACARILEAPV